MDWVKPILLFLKRGYMYSIERSLCEVSIDEFLFGWLLLLSASAEH